MATEPTPVLRAFCLWCYRDHLFHKDPIGEHYVCPENPHAPALLGERYVSHIFANKPRCIGMRRGHYIGFENSLCVVCDQDVCGFRHEPYAQRFALVMRRRGLDEQTRMRLQNTFPETFPTTNPESLDELVAELSKVYPKALASMIIDRLRS